MLKWKTNLAQDSDGLYNARQMINQLTQGLPLANESTVQLADTHLNESSDWSKINYNEYYLFDSLAGLNAPDKQSLIYARGLTIKIGDSNEFIQLAITQDGIGVKYNNTNWSYLLNGSGGSGTSGNYVIDNKDGTVYFNGVTVTLATSKDVQSLTNLIKLKQDKLTYNPADDTKVVHTTDMRKPASEVASIDEVNNKQDAIGYTPANDTQVVHKTGDEEIAGQKTFDNAPIDKTTGNPYITKDGVPSIPSDVARTGQAQTFTAAQTFSIAPTIKDASKDKGDNQAATMADLKSVENSAWHTVTLPDSQGLKNITMIYKIHDDEKYIEANIHAQPISSVKASPTMLNLSGIINKITSLDLLFITPYSSMFKTQTGLAGGASTPSFSSNVIVLTDDTYIDYDDGLISITSNGNPNFAKIYYDSLVNN